ncbi:hypothetical protein VPMG_00086 [Vibrio phage VBP32]|uniref:Uncharacterized protein n=2 Tax=Stoningtonvirus VBP47 TaxID=2846606 RepID=M4SL45_9CAUD|nr:hypothetical protein VPNG_00043 [Vibrio phage VBP47]YP_007676576.1 hypothetical protein VPMG_00086 [Vibrio phage VBP32]AGH57067.1 hypothetical protein VPNG_00043 [Vibrio phage VBP47]AGH57225.1 hypothetical protein VPMG_00086 [Vibrio phage VBP32]
MKIEKSLKIDITQADVEKAVRELIAKEDPTIIVDEIVFTAKRSGNDAISVKVDAHFGSTTEAEPSLTVSSGDTPPPAIPEVTDDAEEEAAELFDGDPLPENAPPLVQEEEEEKQPSPKQSLFG